MPCHAMLVHTISMCLCLVALGKDPPPADKANMRLADRAWEKQNPPERQSQIGDESPPVLLSLAPFGSAQQVRTLKELEEE